MFQIGNTSVGSIDADQGGVMIRLLVGAIGLSVLATTNALAADPVEIGIGYLRRVAIKPTLSLVEQPAENDGVAGAPPPLPTHTPPPHSPTQHLPPSSRT